MATLLPSIQDHFIWGPSLLPGPTANELDREDVILSLNRLYSIAGIGDIIDPLKIFAASGGNAIWIGQSDINGPENAFTGISDSYPGVWLGSGTHDGISLASLNGASQTVSLDHVILHELLHHITRSIGESGWYADETTTFLTNCVAVKYLGAAETVGHVSTIEGSSTSAIHYLTDLEFSELSKIGETTTFRFVGNGIELYKTYHAPDFEGMDHAIRIEAKSNGRVLDDDGTFVDGRSDLILESSVVDNYISRLALLASAQENIEQTMGTLRLIPERLGGTPAWFSQINLNGFKFNQNTLVTLSGERFTEFKNQSLLDVSGPVAANGLTSGSAPDYVTIRDATGNGAIIFGASGAVSDRFDLGNSADRILGTAGNDLIFAGSGTGGGQRRNTVAGGQGRDILIGGANNDTLLGGADSDFIHGSAGSDHIDGGQGLDILSYAASAEGVTVDFAQKNSTTFIDFDGNPISVEAIMASGGDAEGDRISNVEIIHGSNFNDMLKGDGSGRILMGGGGDDAIHIYNGDIAVGGAGADTFHVYTDRLTPNSSLAEDLNINKVIILDFDQEDRLYVDGKLYEGYELGIELALSELRDGEYYGWVPYWELINNSSFGTRRGEYFGTRGDLVTVDIWEQLRGTEFLPSGNYLVSSLKFYDANTGWVDFNNYIDVYIGDFQKGDGGIVFKEHTYVPGYEPPEAFPYTQEPYPPLTVLDGFTDWDTGEPATASQYFLDELENIEWAGPRDFSAGLEGTGGVLHQGGEGAPSIIAIIDTDFGYDEVLEESAAGTLVGITAGLNDYIGDDVQYSLAADANGAFKIDPLTGIVSVNDPSKLAFSDGYFRMIRIRAETEAFQVEKSFRVYIENVNEAPYGLHDADDRPNAVLENALFETPVGITAKAFDPDGADEEIYYSLLDDAGGRFQISPYSGVVTVADGSLLNFEEASSYRIVVEAADYDFSITQEFTINILDDPTEPERDQLPATELGDLTVSMRAAIASESPTRWRKNDAQVTEALAGNASQLQIIQKMMEAMGSFRPNHSAEIDLNLMTWVPEHKAALTRGLPEKHVH